MSFRDRSTRSNTYTNQQLINTIVQVLGAFVFCVVSSQAVLEHHRPFHSHFTRYYSNNGGVSAMSYPGHEPEGHGVLSLIVRLKEAGCCPEKLCYEVRSSWVDWSHVH